MDLDQNKTFAQLAIEGFGNPMERNNKETEPIADYLLRSLEIDYSEIPEDKRNLFQKNFIFILCLVIRDLKIIDSRLGSYKQLRKKYDNDKSNGAEYQRRKIEYFSELNKYARIEIIEFLQTGLKRYLLENEFDALKREEDGDSLTRMFMDRRYKFAYLRDYYDMLFDFSTCVKVNYLPDEDPFELLKVERRYLDLRRIDEIQYRQELHQLVEDKKIMDLIIWRVRNNYHLHKRLQIFEDITQLFTEKHYQSFLALGLLQLEGMFHDLCVVRFGDKENTGTLVEKVQKSLQGRNEYRSVRYYPYFAFDVPIQRNEIAHKGMIEDLDLKDAAYNLVLDLNAVSAMVKEESYDKFNVFLMINNEMSKLESEYPDSQEFRKKIYHTFIYELFSNSLITHDHFWAVLKNPENFRTEMDFYEPKDPQEGYGGIADIVQALSSMIRKEDFWSELLESIKTFDATKNTSPFNIYEFAEKLIREFVSVLTGEAKQKCIDLIKFLKTTPKSPSRP